MFCAQTTVPLATELKDAILSMVVMDTPDASDKAAGGAVSGPASIPRGQGQSVYTATTQRRYDA